MVWIGSPSQALVPSCVLRRIKIGDAGPENPPPTPRGVKKNHFANASLKNFSLFFCAKISFFFASGPRVFHAPGRFLQPTERSYVSEIRMVTECRICLKNRGKSRGMAG